MEITDGAAWLFGAVASAGAAISVWLYARISGVHGRIDKVANHMTDEDNKLHIRIEYIRDNYVRREDLDARLLRIEMGQDKLLEKFEDFDKSMRHKVGNIDQVVTRLDERVKHLEDRK